MIPIENIYYLLCYATGHAQLLNEAQLASISGGKAEDLLGIILSSVTNRALKKGLDRGYISFEEDLRGLRGRVNIRRTAAQKMRRTGRIACDYDEISSNILPNQIIAKTLRALLAMPELSNIVRTQVLSTYKRFPPVLDINLSARLFQDVILHKNNRHYALVIDLCRLVYKNLIVDSDSDGSYRFKDFRRDDAQMGKLFEDFVREFLRVEQNSFAVSSPQINWAVNADSNSSISLLPRMQSDIVLKKRNIVRIIDTKFYSKPLSNYYDSEKLRSHNLYQIFTYVQNYADRARNTEVEGLLLYAMIDDDVHFDCRILNHRISASTINLKQPWPDIYSELMRTCIISSEISA